MPQHHPLSLVQRFQQRATIQPKILTPPRVCSDDGAAQSFTRAAGKGGGEEEALPTWSLLYFLTGGMGDACPLRCPGTVAAAAAGSGAGAAAAAGRGVPSGAGEIRARLPADHRRRFIFSMTVALFYFLCILLKI